MNLRSWLIKTLLPPRRRAFATLSASLPSEQDFVEIPLCDVIVAGTDHAPEGGRAGEMPPLSIPRRIASIGAAVFATVLAAGCASAENLSKMDQVAILSNRAAALAILGQPDGVESVNVLGVGYEVLTWRISEKRCHITVVLDRIAAKECRIGQ